MIWNIILWLMIIWLAPLMYFILKNETKFKKNIAVGVTLPYTARTDPEVADRLSRFRRQLVWVCGALTAAGVPCMLLKDFNLSFTLWCVWLIFCVVLPYIPYVFCNRDLRALKVRRGWRPAGAANGAAVTVDTRTIPGCHWLSPWCFAPALLISLLPLVWDRVMWPIYAGNGVCTVFFWFCYRYLLRSRSEKVDDNAALTLALTQVRRYNWAQLWLACAYALALLSPVILLTQDHAVLLMLSILLVSLVVVFFAMRIELRTRRVQEKLTASSGTGSYVDDDDKWIWGIFYYNPQDSSSIVNDRIGNGSSLNLARPAGKACYALVALLLLAMPFLQPILTAAADKPIELALSEQALTISSGATDYTLALEDLSSAELLDTLPEGLKRVAGTGLENLLKGKFSSPATGSVRLCLDPGHPPFLLLRTTQGQCYLFGTRVEGEVEEIRNILQQRLE